MTMRRSLPLAAALLSAGMLGGCVSFGPKTPATLLTLTADAQPAPGAAQSVKEGRAVTVLSPGVPQALAVLRVPVRSGGNDVAYLKDAQWVDSPAHLFRDVLAATIAAKTGRPVLDVRQYALAPGIRLTGQLERFDLDAPAGQVVVRYAATLVRKDGDVETRRFEATAPASATGASVAAALNKASNEIAGEVADWIGG